MRPVARKIKGVNGRTDGHYDTNTSRLPRGKKVMEIHARQSFMQKMTKKWQGPNTGMQNRGIVISVKDTTTYSNKPVCKISSKNSKHLWGNSPNKV